MMELSLIGALVIGLFGSSHCVMMCGGLCTAIGLDGRQQLLPLVVYNIGRILVYAVIGALAGFIGESLVEWLPATGLLLRGIAGLLIIAMGLYVSQWWQGLTILEQWIAKIISPLQPFSKKLLPVKHLYQALVLGFFWGFLPCGLVYSTLIWSLAAANWQQSSLLMLAFGIGTLPAMLMLGVAGKKVMAFLFQKQCRQIAGILIIAMGLLTVWSPYSHQAMTNADSHQHHH